MINRFILSIYTFLLISSFNLHAAKGVKEGKSLPSESIITASQPILSAAEAAAAISNPGDDATTAPDQPFYVWSYDQQIAYQLDAFDKMANTTEFQRNPRTYPLPEQFKLVFTSALDFASDQITKLQRQRDIDTRAFMQALAQAKQQIETEFNHKKFTVLHGAGVLEWAAKCIDAVYDSENGVPENYIENSPDPVTSYAPSSHFHHGHQSMRHMKDPIYMQLLFIIGGNGIFDYDLMSQGYFRKNAPAFGLIPLSGYEYRENEGAHANHFSTIERLLWHDILHHITFGKKLDNFTLEEKRFILGVIADFINTINAMEISDLDKKVTIHAITHAFHEDSRDMRMDLYCPENGTGPKIKKYNDIRPPFTIITPKTNDIANECRNLLIETLIKTIGNFKKPSHFFPLRNHVAFLDDNQGQNQNPNNIIYIYPHALESVNQIQNANKPEFMVELALDEQEITLKNGTTLQNGDIVVATMDNYQSDKMTINIKGVSYTVYLTRNFPLADEVIPIFFEIPLVTPYLHATSFDGEAIRMYHAALNEGARWILGQYGTYPAKAHEFQDNCFNKTVKPILENLLSDIDAPARATTTTRSTES